MGCRTTGSPPPTPQRINDQHMQQQNTIISESSKLTFYREFYEFGKRASYVDELTNRNDRSYLAKLRLSAHSLEIERVKYSKKAKTPRIISTYIGSILANCC